MLYSAIALLSLLSAVYAQQQQQQQQIIEVPMTANGRQYNIRFLSSSTLSAVTREFCINNAESLGITPLTEASLPECQKPVANHIQQYVQASLAREPATQEIITIELKIHDNTFTLRFHPTAESILEVSRDFCIRHAAALRIEPLTEDSLPGCQNPVVEYMRTAALKRLEESKEKSVAKPAAAAAPPPAAAPAAPDAVRVILRILNQEVPFEVLPTDASIRSVSRDFCIRNKEAIGIPSPLTEKSLLECTQPLVEALVKEVRADAAKKQVAEVKLTVNNNQYLVRFRPAIEPVTQVARDFCVTNAASLGLTQLTEESLPACQTPVAQHLQAQLQSLAV